MSECYRKYFFIDDEIKNCDDFDDNILSVGKCLYDVIRIKNSIPLFLEKYLKRIKRTSELENVNLWISNNDIKQKIFKLIDLNNVEEDSLKIVFSFDNIFFGEKRDIFLAYMMVNNAPTEDQFTAGVNTLTLVAERENPNAKVFNYNLRKRISEIVKDNDIYEVILIDKNNNITEGSRSNLFFIKNEKVYTTVSDKVLPGVTRENIIEICKENNISISETIVPFKELNKYDSVFMTGTSRKVLPINKIDEFKFNVENNTLRKIQKLYNEKILNYIKSNQNNYKNDDTIFTT
jgi:branched-chain amino acid aminotransferase